MLDILLTKPNSFSRLQVFTPVLRTFSTFENKDLLSMVCIYSRRLALFFSINKPFVHNVAKLKTPVYITAKIN